MGKERIAAGALQAQEASFSTHKPASILCADVQRAAGMLIAVYGMDGAAKAKRIRPPASCLP